MEEKTGSQERMKERRGKRRKESTGREEEAGEGRRLKPRLWLDHVWSVVSIMKVWILNVLQYVFLKCPEVAGITRLSYI